MKLPKELPTRSPGEAARCIALAYLAQARKAVGRLGDAADPEALHDLRVAIRRLRSTLRAYRPHLEGTIRKKHRRVLADLAAATSAGRDAEVLLEIAEGERATLRAPHRPGLDFLSTRLRERKDAAYAKARSDVRAEVERFDEKTRDRLATMTYDVRLVERPPESTWAEELARLVRAQIEELHAQLARAGEPENREEAHRARILVKRLRYLAEPARAFAEEAKRVVERCRALQDLLGALNDEALFLVEIDDALATATHERAQRLHDLALADDEEQIRNEVRRSERAGLEELRRRAGERHRSMFAAFRSEWLEGGAAALGAEVETLASRLDVLGKRPFEHERKYLLTSVPAPASSAPATRIEQGWLPGQQIAERVRRSSSTNGAKHTRTIKLGMGVSRTEIEEETSQAVFESLWPLTAGRRVVKDRHRVEEGDLVWEIDVFTDRELVLAEVELPSGDVEPAIPDWLAPHVVREVTGEPEYVNLNLAR